MNDSDLITDHDAECTSREDNRQEDTLLLTLIGLNPSAVVDGVQVPGGYLASEVTFAGPMREVCPVCYDTHLQLVLRQKFVKRPHMFCPQCTRCFDACYADGSTALALA